ncbi:hypothetical protein SUDANB105_04233 [Streptomyces sp. enrichment culture]
MKRQGPHREAPAAAVDPGGTRTAYRPTDITDERQCEALPDLATDGDVADAAMFLSSDRGGPSRGSHCW